MTDDYKLGFAEALERAAQTCNKIADDYGPHELSGHFDDAMGHGARKCAIAIRALSPDVGGKVLEQDYKHLYHELLYAVASKWPDETRHQTALRYIMNAERGSNNAQVAASEKS